MAHSLDLSGVWAKLGRTDEQTPFFNSQWRAFRDDANAYGVEFEKDPQSGGYVVRLRIFKPVDPRLSVIFGEIIHNFRSALDHLVARLVEAYGGTVGTHHSFPICTAQTDFINGVSSRGKQIGKLEGIPRGGKVWTLIEDAQPYKCGSAATDHPFYVINSLWNEDKHRTLNPAHVLPEPADLTDTITFGDTGALCTDIRFHFTRGTPAKDRTTVLTFWFDPRSPEPDMQMQDPLPLDIAFGDGQGQPRDLGTAHAHIANLAIACEQAFP